MTGLSGSLSVVLYCSIKIVNVRVRQTVTWASLHHLVQIAISFIMNCRSPAGSAEIESELRRFVPCHLFHCRSIPRSLGLN